MSYEKTTWQNGDTITAEKLNNIENGIETASGFECTSIEETLFEGSVESSTSYNGAYCSNVIIQNDDLTSDVVKVIFNNVEYTAEKGTFYNFKYYGAPFNGGFNSSSFSTYPFSVFSDGNGFKVATAQLSTNDVVVISVTDSVETSDCFERAVKKLIPKNVVDYGITGLVENSVKSNIASGNYAHAEGHNTTANGDYSHAEGNGTTASGAQSHAEGSNTTASGDHSHAEGVSTLAEGESSHAEGYNTTASGDHSHIEGVSTIANHRSQHVFGEYNVIDQSQATPSNRGTYVEIVGNGLWENSRSNARTLDWSGNESLQGSLTLGKGTADETTITAAQLKALIALLNN